MGRRHTEPSLQGQTKKAKDKRRKLFREVYRFLQPGEVVLASDRECLNGWWKPVRQKWIGIAVDEDRRGQFRRRCKGFVPIE